MEKTQIISPVDGRILSERGLFSPQEIASALDASVKAQSLWKTTSMEERRDFCLSAIEYMVAHRDVSSEEITLQMGRPIRHTPGEINGLEARGLYMIDIAQKALTEIRLPEKPGIIRFIRRTALGVVFVIAPWNYPYLTAINAVIPALMAGNTVLLKHSPQTLLCAERLQAAFDAAGLPKGVFQNLNLSHEDCAAVIKSPEVAFTSFTGSVATGRRIEHNTAGLLKGLALELGGKDPAYVRADAVLETSVAYLVDGAYFNSGQSCCAVERIYVAASLFDDFVEAFVAQVKHYRLGNPLEQDTTLGPLVSSEAAECVREQIAEAVNTGATPCIDPAYFMANLSGSPYLAPQVLIDVDHRMAVMQEESFGPVVGIMKVADDKEALTLMNDSPYGLTASIWTEDAERAAELGNALQTGTVFMNRCDYLDPALAWVGIKDSGRGCALSELGYAQLTRPKSFYLKANP